MKEYIELRITVNPNTEEYREIIIAMLSEAGYETFGETPYGLNAYIESDSFVLSVASEILHPLKASGISLEFESVKMPNVNWNQEWEKNFSPIIIDNQCVVKAPFHKDTPNTKYVIEIMPKMSFGTGHHQTTSLMIEWLLETECKGKSVLDMGSGTGILAILASMKGAHKITAVDIDEWAYENALENAERNSCSNIDIHLGGAELLMGKKFDIIMANINRNILLEQISIYKTCCQNKGLLAMSGFYISDLDDISNEAKKNGFLFLKYHEKDKWGSAVFQKL